jgi:hypothetical protein
MPLLTVPDRPQPDDAPRRPRGTVHRLWAQMREVVVDAQGNHHASKGSAIGGQFIPKGGSGTGASGSSLQNGSVEETNPMGGGVNASLLVTLEDGTKAIFKPEIGEAWSLDFSNPDINRALTNRQLSLAEREAMAYEVDQALGLGLVPETVHRKTLPGADLEGVESEDDNAPVYDRDELEGMYEEYRQDNFERAAEVAGEELSGMYAEAQEEHVQSIKNRVEEIEEIWNDLIDENPEYDDANAYGSRSARGEHPPLPLGSAKSFQRGFGGEVDPLEVIEETNVDVESAFSSNERDIIRTHLERQLRNGAQTLLDLDEDRARDHLDYGDWLEGHSDTENRLIDQHLLSFDDWAAQKGYNVEGGGRQQNREAPHPEGGSLQRFVDDLSEYGDIDSNPEAMAKFAVLDFAIGSMDRHGGNIMFSGDDGDPIAIDNGYSMPDRKVTFRSVPVRMWLRQGQGEVPEGLRQRLLGRLTSTSWDTFTKAHPSMSKGEEGAFLRRIEDLRRALKTPEGLRDLWEQQELMN